MSNPVVETHALGRSFDGRTALDSLTMQVGEGEVVALLGPNGAGKTTTVRLLNGLLRPDSGRSTVLGLDPVVDGHLIRQRTGVLTENAGLDDRLTAKENLLMAARVRHVEAPERTIDDLLDRFGMADRRDDFVQGFSTGQRKRVALARALLAEPDVLFLDEPTSGLDPEATRDVVSLISSLSRDHQRTVLLATHFLGEAGELADHMAVLHHGRLLAYGRPADLAAELWDDVTATVELGGPADPAALQAMGAVPGVVAVADTAAGARLQITDREVMPRVMAALVASSVPVYGGAVAEPDLEDVYFRVLARHRAAGDDDGRGQVEPGWARAEAAS